MDAHIPITLRARVLVMESADAITGNIPTIFLGIVHKEYTNEMWEKHSQRIRNLFKITDGNRCCHIKVVPAAEAANVVNSDKLAEEMSKAMTMIQDLQPKTIRIVGLGVGSSLAVTEALESLLLGWEIPADEKEVQFVALGESADFHYLNFCKNLCMKQMIKSLQYYNTMDFNNFGHLRTAGGLAGVDMQQMRRMMAMMQLESGGNDPVQCSSLGIR